MSSQKEADPYKEGQVVTWKFNDHFILKTKLGARRTHISTGSHDAEFYRPESEHYVGQFPIDYVPEQFAKLTEAEAKQMQPVAIIPGQVLEFNLMLNSSTVQATDKSPYGLHDRDSPDQVKVFITSFGLNDPNRNTKQSFDLDFMREVDPNSKITQYGLDCYKFKDGSDWKRCFGSSKNKMISGFDFHISPNKDTSILVRSDEFIYRGIKVEWFTDQKNVDQARDIDAAIWRLLATWNVSPIQK